MHGYIVTLRFTDSTSTVQTLTETELKKVLEAFLSGTSDIVTIVVNHRPARSLRERAAEKRVCSDR